MIKQENTKRCGGTKSVTLVATLLLSITFVGCATTSTNNGMSKETRAKQTQHLSQLNELDEKRSVTLKQIRSKSIQELIALMDKDADSGRESFNSLAFREITSNRKDQNAVILIEVNRAKKQTSLLTLLALREVHETGYRSLSKEMRATVFLRALAKSKSYNQWGLPHLYWEDAAKGIIELGNTAVPGLKKLLTDKSPAVVWGSEEVAESEAFSYRRCDYALALIRSIRNQSNKNLPRSVAKRDGLIKTMLGE